MPDPVNFTKDGRTVTLSDPNEIATAYDQGWRPETPTEHAADVAAKVQTEQFGGPVGKFAALGTGALRTVTLGGSDVLGAALGAAPELRALKEENPLPSTIGEVGGAFLPVGGAALLGKVGRAVTGLGEGAGTVAKIGYGALGGVAEGGLFGAGAGVSDLALSDDPLTIERIGSVLGSSTLYGAGIGAVAGGLGKAAELGLRRAKDAVDTAVERRAMKAKTPAEAIESGDLSLLDKRMLDAAEEGEIARITKEQAPQREAFTEELNTWRRANRDAHDIRAITKASEDVNLREASGAFDRANFKLRAALDDKVGFAEDPLASLKAVRTQAQALEEMQAAAQAQRRAWQEAVDTAPQRFREDIEAISSRPTLAERTAEARARGGLVDYTGPFTPAGLDNAVERAVKEYSSYQWGGAIRHGLKEPSIVSRIPKIEEMIAANQRLQSQLEALAKPPTSDLLTKIADARAALDVPKQPSLMQAGISAVAPFAGPLGVAAAAGNRVLSSFKKVAGAVADRTLKASQAFLGKAAPAVEATTPLATRTLAALYFGSRKKRDDEPATLAGLYQNRTNEVKSQVQIAADGSFQMRPNARQALADKLKVLRVSAPVLADRLETQGAKRIEWLASQIPRRPDAFSTAYGPDR